MSTPLAGMLVRLLRAREGEAVWSELYRVTPADRRPEFAQTIELLEVNEVVEIRSTNHGRPGRNGKLVRLLTDQIPDGLISFLQQVPADISPDEYQAVRRLAREQGVATDRWVGDLIRRELAADLL